MSHVPNFMCHLVITVKASASASAPAMMMVVVVMSMMTSLVASVSTVSSVQVACRSAVALTLHLLLFLVLLMPVLEGVCADSTHHSTHHRSQHAAASLVGEEAAARSTDQGGSDAPLAVRTDGAIGTLLATAVFAVGGLVWVGLCCAIGWLGLRIWRLALLGVGSWRVCWGVAAVVLLRRILALRRVLALLAVVWLRGVLLLTVLPLLAVVWLWGILVLVLVLVRVLRLATSVIVIARHGACGDGGAVMRRGESCLC